MTADIRMTHARAPLTHEIEVQIDCFRNHLASVFNRGACRHAAGQVGNVSAVSRSRATDENQIAHYGYSNYLAVRPKNA